MRNTVRLKIKLRIVSRLVIALTGFFVLFLMNRPEFGIAIDGVHEIVAGYLSDEPENEIIEEVKEPLVDENEIADYSDQFSEKCYMVKINELTFGVRTKEDVIKVLTAAKNRYDLDDEYEVVLANDNTRKVPAITAYLRKKTQGDDSGRGIDFKNAGAGLRLMQDGEVIVAKEGVDVLKDLAFDDKVEITKSYMPDDKLISVDDAIVMVTCDKQKEEKYEVIPGDTLSQIAEKNKTTMENLIAINEVLKDENSTIRVGDELTITVPQPELSFRRVVQQYYEENYEGEVEYVPNDEWYTTKQITLQDPVAGFHKVVADVTYRNDREEDRVIKQEEIVAMATPKIVERGTIVPPSFLKPISGGRVSSGYGKRTAPKKGASTFHKGIDWATPVGTAVCASSGGIISRAGWGSGYGNVVYIDHPDGRQTRYGHLSKVLVKAGQKVNQGEKIALSGNTGRSTGPHLHFEILVNGSAVDPYSVMN